MLKEHAVSMTPYNTTIVDRAPGLMEFNIYRNEKPDFKSVAASRNKLCDSFSLGR